MAAFHGNGVYWTTELVKAENIRILAMYLFTYQEKLLSYFCIVLILDFKLTRLENAVLFPKDLDDVAKMFSVETADGILKAVGDRCKLSNCFRL